MGFKLINLLFMVKLRSELEERGRFMKESRSQDCSMGRRRLS
jgi:hypothetical protein